MANVSQDLERTHPNLAAFLRQLRADGFRIGMAEIVAAHRAVLAFPERDFTGLGSIIAPVVCTSERDQEHFQALFRGWTQAFSSDDAHQEMRLEDAVSNRRIFIKRALVRSTGLIAILALAVWLASHLLPIWFRPEPPPPPVQEGGTNNTGPPTGTTKTRPIPENLDRPMHLAPEPYVEIFPRDPAPEPSTVALWIWLAASLALVPTVGFIAWKRWVSYQAKELAGGRFEKTRAPFQNIFHPRSRTGVFEDGSFSRVAAGLRRHREETSKRIDVEATLHKTLASGGLPSPVHASRKLSPEYLVLVDRRAYPDHLAWFLEEILLRLTEEGVYVDSYEFEEDARAVWLPSENRKRTQPLALSSLTSRFEHHRLLIFGNARAFMSPASGKMPRWSEIFSHWSCRAFFDSEPPSTWGSAEQCLNVSGFQVFPADRTGLARFIEQINRTRQTYDWLGGETPRLPKVLRPWAGDADHLDWEDDDDEGPDVDEVGAIVAGLRRYLGNTGYAWLCACAVPPALDWNVTLCLGHNLSDKQGCPLMREDRLGALARLRWFRLGELPEWLRPSLVADLPEDLIEKTRHVLTYLLLQGSPQAPLQGYQIDERTAATLEATEAISEIVAQARPNSAAYDQTFATFLTGKPVKRDAGGALIRDPKRQFISMMVALMIFVVSSIVMWAVVRETGTLAKVLWWFGAAYCVCALSAVFNQDRRKALLPSIAVPKTP